MFNDDMSISFCSSTLPSFSLWFPKSPFFDFIHILAKTAKKELEITLLGFPTFYCTVYIVHIPGKIERENTFKMLFLRREAVFSPTKMDPTLLKHPQRTMTPPLALNHLSKQHHRDRRMRTATQMEQQPKNCRPKLDL
jgi:hypothetical protein